MSEQVLSGGPSAGRRVGCKVSALEHLSPVSSLHGKGLLALDLTIPFLGTHQTGRIT